MVKRCVAGGCSNTATTDVSLHYFPVNTEIRAAWTTAVKLTRDGWDGPTKHSVLCSDHFPADCFKQETSEFARGMMTEMGLVYRRRRALKADAIPTLFVSSSVKVSSKKNLSQAVAKRNQAQQDAVGNFNFAFEHDHLIICHSPTSDNDRTSNMSIQVNPAPSDAFDCSMSENNILQNIGNPHLIKEKADLQVTNILAGDDAHQTVFTEMTLETASDSVPEVVYLVGEENDEMDLSDVSSDPSEVDSGEDWQPEDELLFDDELQAESDDEIFDDEDESIPSKHLELCTDCGKFFRKEKPHTCKHKIKPFSCIICGKRFINELSLKRHTRVHDASYEVSCKCCHMKFKTKADKTVHERKHLTEEKPFKCPDCSETFATYNKRKIHLKVHRGPEELKCHFCGLEFSRKCFQRHIVVHTGEKPHKCVVCKRGFNQAGNLKSHMRLHTGEKPYKCHHCDQSFNHNVSLKSHIKRCHTPSSENQQKKTNKRKHDSGDYQDFWDKDPDSCLVESEQDTDDVVQLEETHRRKTKKTNTGRRGRPKRKKEVLFQADEAQEQGSDTNSAKIFKTRRTRTAQTSKTPGSLTQ